MIIKAPTNSGAQIADNLVDQLPLRNVVWAAMEKIAGKQKQSDGLVDGSRHTANFDLQGIVDGQVFKQSIDSILTVGHRQTRASSVTPAVPELLAYILGKLNHNTRQRILADIPVEFASSSQPFMEDEAGLVDQSKQLLAQLRRNCMIETRGPIHCEFILTK